jgi:rod shape-determining protein MreD
MSSMDLSPASRSPMGLPAPIRLIVGSMLVALLLNLLPWSGVALHVRPDFVLLMLIYWTVHEPRAIGQGWGFALGLVMDVAGSVLLGQHALVYVVAIFLTQLLRMRMLQLTVVEQAMHALVILVASQSIGVMLNLLLGREFPGLLVASAPALGALVWPLANYFVTRPRFRRRSSGVIH